MVSSLIIDTSLQSVKDGVSSLVMDTSLQIGRVKDVGKCPVIETSL